MTISIPVDLPDHELMAVVPRLSGDERVALARLVAHLAELDRRRLYVPAGYASLYAYCREGLGHSEDAAYNRKTAAQVARRYPAVLEMLADGRLSLTAVRLLAPVLRDDHWEATLAAAAGKSKRDVEMLVARLAPKPDVPPSVRKVPVHGAGAGSAPAVFADPAVPERREAAGAEETQTPAAAKPVEAAKRPLVAPLAPERYRVQFTIGSETEGKLRRLQELMRREIPSGDPAAIFDRALTVLLAQVEGRKHGATARPRVARPLGKGSRRVPAATRREVSPRDGSQCTFVAADGRRCTERAYLEYHHAGRPFARGGGPEPGNIALHCRAHNALEGERIFGRNLPPEVRDARVRYDDMRFPVPERQAEVPPAR